MKEEIIEFLKSRGDFEIIQQGNVIHGIMTVFEPTDLDMTLWVFVEPERCRFEINIFVFGFKVNLTPDTMFYSVEKFMAGFDRSDEVKRVLAHVKNANLGAAPATH